MKAQVALEYLVIVSVALLILVPLVLYANQMFLGYKENTRISLAKNAVKKIGEHADWVYSQGRPARNEIQVYMPDGIEEASLENNEILLKIKTSAGTSDIFYRTVSPLNGSIPYNSGYYIISLVAFQNYVNISW